MVQGALMSQQQQPPSIDCSCPHGAVLGAGGPVSESSSASNIFRPPVLSPPGREPHRTACVFGSSVPGTRLACAGLCGSRLS